MGKSAEKMAVSLVASCAAIASAAAVAATAFGDSLGNVGDVRLKGYLGERLEIGRAHV